MPRLDPVLRHATTAPAFDPTKIHRERLVDLVHSFLPRKLIVVAAPAGYGKTMLLADFTAHSDFPVFWVRLTPADHDERRLAEMIVASLRRRFRRVVKEIRLNALVGATPEALGRALGEAMGSVGEPLVLVLDDVHHLNTSKPALAVVDAMIEAIPSDSSIIASGREVLEVSLAKLMAEENLAGIGPQDMSLTAEELRTLAEQRGSTGLSDNDFVRILEETRGWLAGVLLSGVLQGRRSAGPIDPNRPLVHDYLASVVLNRQPEVMRAFLLESSVLPFMTAEACDTVLKRSDSSRMLGRLSKEGIFVTASIESPRTYEYHPQFRDFLLTTLGDTDAVRLQRVRLRAARYAERTGQVDYAVELFLDSGQAAQARRLAERHAKQMFEQARVQTLQMWADRLQQAGTESAMVLRYLAVAYADLGRIAEAENVLDRAHRAVEPGATRNVRALLEDAVALVAYYKGDSEEALRRTANCLEILGADGDRLLRSYALGLRAMATMGMPGGLPEAERLAEESMQLLGDSRSKLDRADAMRLRGSIRSARGRISQARGDFAEALRLVRDDAPALSLASHLNNLAWNSHLLGQYDAAVQQYSQALREARLVGSDLREAMILYGMADVYNDVGLPIQAAELYGEGLSVVTRIDSRSWVVYGCVRTAALYRRRGLPDVSREWLKRARHLTGPQPRSNMLAVEEALALVQSQPMAAQQYLDEILALPEHEVEPEVRALAWIGKVRTQLRLNLLEGARAALAEALAWAGPREQEQVLAAELLNDEDLRRAVARVAGDHPVAGVVLNRVEAMRAFESLHTQAPPAAEEKPARLDVRALGGARIALGGVEARAPKPQLRELFLYLLDHGAVPRDVLGEVFWPASPPGKRNANIHMAIHSLRRWIGATVVDFDGGSYRLSPSLEVIYDVAGFRRARGVALALPRGDPRRFFALTEAVNSYTGDFLPEVVSEWAVERRRELEIQYLEVLAAYGEEALTRDQPQRAVEHIRRGLAMDPYRDDLNAQYMEALGRLGRRSEVVTHYQRYTNLLESDLGLEPPREVRDLYARIIR
jgi:ATP/maltotriose-dependent transcriptional regulator MalT/DNA-binding SARP family transcriptional activator